MKVSDNTDCDKGDYTVTPDAKAVLSDVEEPSALEKDWALLLLRVC